MANYTQYNGNVGSTYYNFFLSQVPYGTDYIIFRSEDYYICVYGDFEENYTFKNTTVLKISTTYNQQGTVIITNEDTTTIDISYLYYTYSNVGYGTIITHPNTNNILVHQECLQTSILFIILLAFIGFNIIRKRWVDSD